MLTLASGSGPEERGVAMVSFFINIALVLSVTVTDPLMSANLPVLAEER